MYVTYVLLAKDFHFDASICVFVTCVKHGEHTSMDDLRMSTSGACIVHVDYPLFLVSVLYKCGC